MLKNKKLPIIIMAISLITVASAAFLVSCNQNPTNDLQRTAASSSQPVSSAPVVAVPPISSAPVSEPESKPASSEASSETSSKTSSEPASSKAASSVSTSSKTSSKATSSKATSSHTNNISVEGSASVPASSAPISKPAAPAGPKDGDIKEENGIKYVYLGDINEWAEMGDGSPNQIDDGNWDEFIKENPYCPFCGAEYVYGMTKWGAEDWYCPNYCKNGY